MSERAQFTWEASEESEPRPLLEVRDLETSSTLCIRHSRRFHFLERALRNGYNELLAQASHGSESGTPGMPETSLRGDEE